MNKRRLVLALLVGLGAVNLTSCHRPHYRPTMGVYAPVQPRLMPRLKAPRAKARIAGQRMVRPGEPH